MIREHPRLVVFAALALAFAVSLLKAQTPDIQQNVAKMLGQMRQPGLPLDAPTPPSSTAPALTLPTDPASRRKLEAARDYIQTREWPEAVGLLQGLLDKQTDSFLKVPSGKEGDSVWRSTRAEAERLLAALPAEGLRFYQLAHDPPAQRMLQEALNHHDFRKLTEVVRRYRFTPAGAAALNTLAAHHLDRGRHDLAALCYQRLLQQPGISKLTPLALFQSCLAFQAAGDRERLQQVWQTLEGRIGKEGLRLRNRPLSADEVRQVIERWNPTRGTTDDWLLYRGNLERTQAGVSDTPLLEPVWQVSTTTTEAGRQWLGRALRRPASAAPFLPGGTPLSVGGKLIFRSQAGVCAVDNETGRSLWHTHLPLSLESILANPARKVQLDRWLGMYTTLYPNSSQGTLSSDGRLVFAIDDLPLPPHPTHIQEMQNGKKHYFGTLRDAIYHNRLVALDASTGAIAWSAGGRSGKIPAELVDAWFLGPPLPLGNNIYALIEKKQDLSLVCLGSGSGELLWTLHLASARASLLLNINRRLHAAPLAYRDGLLVCSTHAGVVVAVNVLSRSLAWAHQYPVREWVPTPEGETLLNLTGVDDRLQGCAPLISEDHVVVTSPDAETIRCLQLNDGALVWKRDLGEEDRYIAVYKDKVLVVGQTSCRALSVARGEILWERNTPPPAGQGTFCLVPGGPPLYYLPLQSGDVLVLNLDRPTESTSLSYRGAGGSPALGNLLFQGGRLWSQTPTAVTAFPALAPRLAQVEERLKAALRDPRLLQERARCRLDRGELAQAVADLRLARELAGPDSALARQLRQQSYDALTALLQRDFDAGESHLEEYRLLCRLPIPAGATPEQRKHWRKEERRRQTRFQVLLAQGREGQGKFREALTAYQQVHELGEGGELLNFPDLAGVKQRADVWAQLHVADLLRRAEAQKAPGEARQHLREQMDRDWRAASTTALARYLNLFERVSGAAWPELLAARTALLERWAQARDRSQALSILFHLLDIEKKGETPGLRGRALEVRARLLTDLGLPEDAAECYRELRRRYGRERLTGGRTSDEIFDDVSTDKRLLAHLPLAVSRGSSASRSYRATESTGAWPLRMMIFTEILPAFGDPDTSLVPVQLEHSPAGSLHHLRFHVETGSSRLVAVSRSTGTECWSVTLPFAVRSWEATPTLNWCIIDHVAVITLSTTLLAVDLLDRRVLWTRNLVDEGAPEQVTGPLGRAGVYLQTRSGLLALDLLTGQPRWLRSEVPREMSAFGDDQALFLLKMQSPEMDMNLAPVQQIRCVRALDGLAVRIPDAVSVLNNRKRILGHAVAYADSGPGKNAVVVHLHDLLTGKELWSKSFPEKSIVLESSIPELLAVAQPDGIVALVDLEAVRDGTPASVPQQLLVDAKHVKNLQGGWLLRDQGQLYLAFTGPPTAMPGLIDAPAPYFQGDLNGVPVDGALYAFDRGSGARRWLIMLPSQTILTSRFEELPLLLCAAISQRQKDPAMPPEQRVSTLAIDKRTGKVCHKRETVNAADPFHTLLMEPRTGTIDLLSLHRRLRFTLEPRQP